MADVHFDAFRIRPGPGRGDIRRVTESDLARATANLESAFRDFGSADGIPNGEGLTASVNKLQQATSGLRHLLREIPTSDKDEVSRLRLACSQVSGLLLRSKTSHRGAAISVEVWQVIGEALAACVSSDEARYGKEKSLENNGHCIQALVCAARELEAANRAEEAESLIAKAHPFAVHVEELLSDTNTSAARLDRTNEGRLRSLIFDLYLCRSRIANSLGLAALCSNSLSQACAAVQNLAAEPEVARNAACELASDCLTMAKNASDIHKDHGHALKIYEAALETLALIGGSDVSDDVNEALSALKQHVIFGLVLQHLNLERPQDALRCWHQLMQSKDTQNSQEQGKPKTTMVQLAAIHYLGVRLHCALSNYEEATEQAKEHIQADGSTWYSSFEVIRMLAEASQGEAAVNILFAAMDWYNDNDCSPALALVELMVKEGPAENEELSLQIVADSRLAQLGQTQNANEKASECRQELYGILFDKGIQLWEIKEWRRASLFFSAALSMSSITEKTKTARVIALCQMADGDLLRAKEFIQVAESIDPTDVYTAFLVFKLQLMSNADIEDLRSQLSKLLTCDGFQPDIFNIASCEAIRSSNPAAAEHALFLLFTLTAQDSGGKGTAGKEGLLLRNAIKLALENDDDKQRAVKYFDAGRKRLEAVGFAQFFGALPSSDTMGKGATDSVNEAVWLAGRAFNFSEELWRENRWIDAETVINASSSFYVSILANARMHLNDSQRSTVENGIIDSTGQYALIAMKNVSSPEFDESDDFVQSAAKHSVLLKEALAIESNLCVVDGEPISNTGIHRRRFLNLLYFESLCRISSAGDVLQLCRKVRGEKGFTGLDFFSMGMRCTGESESLPMIEVGYECLQSAVQMLDIERDPAMTLTAFRNLIAAAHLLSRDTLKIHNEVGSLLSGKVVPEEGQDDLYNIACTAFNKGRRLVLNGQKGTGLEWWKASRQLAPSCPDFPLSTAELNNCIETLEDDLAVEDI